MLDIIIPVLNEEKILTEQQAYYRSLKDKANIVFVDGGSSDRTVAIARQFGQIIISSPGRAIQKNRGANETTAENLLFLHVDAYINPDTLDECLSQLDGHAAACLTMKIEDKGGLFRVYERVVNYRARKFGIADGDLGLFVKRKTFNQVGAFDNFQVMEDLEFGRKLRKIGKIKQLPQAISVSSRRWHEHGFFGTFLRYTWAYIQLWMGWVNPNAQR